MFHIILPSLSQIVKPTDTALIISKLQPTAHSPSQPTSVTANDNTQQASPSNTNTPRSRKQAKPPNGQPTEKRRRLTSNDIRPTVKQLATAVIVLKNHSASLLDSISDPADKLAVSTALQCLETNTSDLANLSRYEEPNDLPKLVSGIERSQFQSKLEDSQANITKKDVFDLITSFADSSIPTFTIPSNNSSKREKSLMVANAFDLTGPVPEYDLLFSKGIFVRVEIPPHQLLQIYKLKNEEPKTTGKKKKGTGTFRQTTCNIWQTSLIDNDYINYRCSLGILENKEKRKKLQRSDKFTYVLWIKDKHLTKWLVESGIKKTKKRKDEQKDEQK